MLRSNECYQFSFVFTKCSHCLKNIQQEEDCENKFNPLNILQNSAFFQSPSVLHVRDAAQHFWTIYSSDIHVSCEYSCNSLTCVAGY